MGLAEEAYTMGILYMYIPRSDAYPTSYLYVGYKLWSKRLGVPVTNRYQKLKTWLLWRHL